MKQEREHNLLIMKSFKGNIDYEGRILRDQAIRDGYYETGFNDQCDEGDVSDWETEPKTFKNMVTESKYFLMGALQNKNSEGLVNYG